MDKLVEANLRIWGKTKNDLEIMKYSEILSLVGGRANELLLYRLVKESNNIQTIKDYIDDNELNLTKAHLKRKTDIDKEYYNKKEIIRGEEVSEKLTVDEVLNNACKRAIGVTSRIRNKEFER